MSEPLDPTTGLPVLPEGYFWKVSFTELGAYYYDGENVLVSIRQASTKPRWVTAAFNWFMEWERTVADASVKLTSLEEDDIKEDILVAASLALRKWATSRDRIVYNSKYVEVTEKIAGKYPPKTLS